MNADEISLRLTRQQAEEFLQKLEEDDDFRGRLAKGGSDTRDALARLGIEVPPELIPEKIVLPERKDIAYFRGGTEPEEGSTSWIDIFWIDIVGGLLALCGGFKRRESPSA
jgi:hypothetical protein